MVNITKSNFLKESNNLINQLPTAAFVALDLEMTGISLPTDDTATFKKTNSSNPNLSNASQKEDTPEERYQRLKAVPERYSIIQVGIAIFHENSKFRTYLQRKKRELQPHEYGTWTCTTIHGQEQEQKDQKEEEEEEVEKDLVERKGHEEHVGKQSMSTFHPLPEDPTKSNIEQNIPHDILPQGEIQENTPSTQILDPKIHNGNENNIQKDSEEENESDNDNKVVEDYKDQEDTHESNMTTEPPEFLVTKYNFYLFPPSTNHVGITREITLNPSSISFLNEHDMDFNLWIKQGIPYTTLERAEALLEEFKRKHEEKIKTETAAAASVSASPQNNSTPPVDITSSLPFPQASPIVTLSSQKKRPTLEPNRPEDIAFVARAMASLREWLDSAQPPPRKHGSLAAVDEEREGIAYFMPPCNSFLRRCLYEAIQYEYPSLLLEKGQPPNVNAIRVLRLTPQEKKDRDHRLRREEWNSIHLEKIGFTRVFKALSDACCGTLGYTGRLRKEFQRSLYGKVEEETNTSTKPLPSRQVPIVVHNGFMDLLFLLTHCYSHHLPDDYGELKGLISRLFPCIYDTKVMSSECSDTSIRNESTALGDLFSRICLRSNNTNVNHNNNENNIPRVKVVNEPHDQVNSLALHEAAFDAYMTGSVFHALCRRLIGPSVFTQWLQRGGNNILFDVRVKNDGFGSFFFLDTRNPLYYTSKLFGRNKLFLMRTMYNIDMDERHPEKDPLKGGISPSCTYRVSGIECTVTTRDIVRSLMHIVDTEGVNTTSNEFVMEPARVLYEIIWVDDSTFMVSTRLPDDRNTSPSQNLMLALSSNSVTDSILHQELERDKVMQRQGILIFGALKKRFVARSIVSLEEHLTSRRMTVGKDTCNKVMEDITVASNKEVEEGQTNSSGLSSLWNGVLELFGFDVTNRKRPRANSSASNGNPQGLPRHNNEVRDDNRGQKRLKVSD